MSSLWISFFFFRQRKAYEMRISDWSSDVCSSDLHEFLAAVARDMAIIARNLRQCVGDDLEHAIAGVVAVGVVDRLEIVDVAKGDAQRDGLVARLAVMAFEQRLEGAAVGQAGQIGRAHV